ncbi:MAG: hypothetical protein Q8K96_18025 [Rubrivivax sp.]|nr:hypothetical protein [Rubrivivax sp.]
MRATLDSSPREFGLRQRYRYARWPIRLASAGLIVGLFGGCGDSSDSPPPPATVTLSGVVADGLLQGVTACYDLNNDGACGSTEPVSSVTSANGAYSITVLATDAGAHAVIANVPATAIDQTTGVAIGVATTFKAPATGITGAQTVFVSPLTTLVQTLMDASGHSAAVATAFVKEQSGLSLSPLSDFTALPNDPNAQQAATLARLTVLTQQRLALALAPKLGQNDLTGTAITQADIDKSVGRALLGALPALTAAATDPAVTGAADKQAALAAAAQDLVATQPALDAADVLALIGATRSIDAGPVGTPTATATLRGFRYTDANNWTYRAEMATAGDNTPDANQLTRRYFLHAKAEAGATEQWGFGTVAKRQGDLHWNGSAWVACMLGQRSSQAVPDALGRRAYDFCNKFAEGVLQRSALDIAGQTLQNVVSLRIRAFPAGSEESGENGVDFVNWGPADLGLLGGGSFPQGSLLYYDTTQPLKSAFAYDVNNIATGWNAAVAAGGNAQADPTLACRQAFIGTLQASPVATLEALAASHQGAPCQVNSQTDAYGSSLTPNLWFNNFTAGMGNALDLVARPAGTGLFFTTIGNLRVSFTANSTAVTYYLCYARTTGTSILPDRIIDTVGAPRNCSVIGSGSYAIQTMGDARVMTFANLPTVMHRMGFNRVFIERGGTVYAGYQNAVGSMKSKVRLNLTAANAVFGVLGLAPLTPQ